MWKPYLVVLFSLRIPLFPNTDKASVCVLLLLRAYERKNNYLREACLFSIFSIFRLRGKYKEFDFCVLFISHS